MRARWRHDGSFSSRDSVGWLIRSSPVSARRPQASLKVGSQRIEIVAILIAAADGKQACPDHVGIGMGRICGVAFVINAGGQHAGKQQNAAVRR
jgi:hypothetical protein